jgi:hypothetical protein
MTTNNLTQAELRPSKLYGLRTKSAAESSAEPTAA